MTKDIRFSGLAQTPSDYDCPDGQAHTLCNLIPEDAALRPFLQPATQLSLPIDSTPLYIHQATGYRHYIILVTSGSTNTLHWADTAADSFTPDANNALGLTLNSANQIKHINSVGNTLMIFTPGGIQYFLWKPQTSQYLHLGNHIPECQLIFALEAEMKRSQRFSIEPFIDANAFTNPDITILKHTQSGEYRTKVTQTVLAQVNKFIAEESVGKGKFIYPFFVRFAYRLYDGTLTMHSAPILMIPSSAVTPRVIWTKLVKQGNNPTRAYCYTTAPVCELIYRLVDEDFKTKIRPWADIVKSVDIFVSAPIYTYDQNGEVDALYDGAYAPPAEDDNAADSYADPNADNHAGTNWDALFGFSISRQKNVHRDQLGTTAYRSYLIAHRNISDMYMLAFEPGKVQKYLGGYVGVPGRPLEKVKEDIRNCSTFYFLRSIPVEDLEGEHGTVLHIPDDYLQSLVNREVMSDDYDSHNTLIPEFSHNYNSRLNIAGIKKKLFPGYRPFSIFAYTDGHINPHNTLSETAYAHSLTSFSVRVYLRKDGRNIVVDNPADTANAAFFPELDSYSQHRGVNPHNPFYYFYYPDPDAYRAVITPIINGTARTDCAYILDLEPHDHLNGAFYFNGWDSPQADDFNPAQDNPSADPIINLPNKLYTSEVNNPFVFPVTGISTIGLGAIRAITSAAKPLSQGQFGQFPLYAFTDEGIWALQVNSNGTFMPSQPISQDVCSNPASITQLDSAVIFATDRGLMLIEGSQVTCISDILGTNLPQQPQLLLPGSDPLLTDTPAFNPAVLKLCLTQGGTLYDYTTRRIFLFHPTLPYSFLYSIPSQSWTTVTLSLQSKLNSYPHALATTSDAKIINLSTPLTPHRPLSPQTLLTRPIKLDAPDILKTVDTLIARGQFQRGHVKTILYGSRDLQHWHPLKSSTDHFLRCFSGTPWKYFRLLLITNLDPHESISAATLQFNTRLMNQPR